MLCMAVLTGATQQEAASPNEPDARMGGAYNAIHAIEYKDESGRVYKIYKYDGMEFKVFSPVGNSMPVEGAGGVGSVSVDTKRRVYLYSTPGVISYPADTPKQAVDNVAAQLITNSGRPPVEQLSKGLDDFYEKLGRQDAGG